MMNEILPFVIVVTIFISGMYILAELAENR